MVEFGNRKLAIVAIGIGGIGALIALTAGGGPASWFGFLFSGLGAFGGVLLLKYGYLIIPWLTTRSNIIMMNEEGYEIPASQDVIIRRGQNEVYYASVFLGIRIYQSAVEMTEHQIRAYNQYFERAMANFKRVVKISYMMHAIDITEQKKRYEEKRAEAQLRLQKEREKQEPDVLKIQRYEREIVFYNLQLDRMIKGERPMRVIAYAMTTAVGTTKEEAVSKAKTNAGELKSLLANALNVDVDTLQADEMLKIFEWEKFIPVTVEELEEQAEIKTRGR